MAESPDSKEASSEKRQADCYAAADRGFMRWGQELRARMLAPLLNQLIKADIHADHITLAAMVCGLAFCPLYFYHRGAALIALGLHVALDGLDGPLARARGEAGRKGSFTDTAADQLVVAGSTITLIYSQHIGVLVGSIYVLAYTIVVGFSMIRNALGIPYSWLVRPRFFVYLYLIVELYFFPHTLSYVLWLCNGLLAWKVFTGFKKIRNKI